MPIYNNFQNDVQGASFNTDVQNDFNQFQDINNTSNNNFDFGQEVGYGLNSPLPVAVNGFASNSGGGGANTVAPSRIVGLGGNGSIQLPQRNLYLGQPVEYNATPNTLPQAPNLVNVFNPTQTITPAPLTPVIAPATNNLSVPFTETNAPSKPANFQAVTNRVVNDQRGDDGWSATEIYEFIVEKFKANPEQAWAIASSIIEDKTGQNVADPNGGILNDMTDDYAAVSQIHDNDVIEAFRVIASESGGKKNINDSDIEKLFSDLDAEDNSGLNQDTAVVSDVFFELA